MKYLILFLLFVGFSITTVNAQESINPSLIIDEIVIPSDEFNTVLREAPVRTLDKVHAISWQVTFDNNLLYANPDGNAVIRFYDQESDDEFIEIGMGSQPDYKYWVAVQTPDEGYIVVHRDLDRGWNPDLKSIVSYTDKAGMTVNNGVRIVVTNLDIGVFAIDSYSVHGKEGSTDPPAVNSGTLTMEFLSGDPSQNVFALFPFFVAAGVGVIVGVLFLTKKRN